MNRYCNIPAEEISTGSITRITIDCCPLEAPVRKLIATMLTIKCADPSEANRLRQSCKELTEPAELDTLRHHKMSREVAEKLKAKFTVEHAFSFTDKVDKTFAEVYNIIDSLTEG